MQVRVYHRNRRAALARQDRTGTAERLVRSAVPAALPPAVLADCRPDLPAAVLPSYRQRPEVQQVRRHGGWTLPRPYDGGNLAAMAAGSAIVAQFQGEEAGREHARRQAQAVAMLESAAQYVVSPAGQAYHVHDIAAGQVSEYLPRPARRAAVQASRALNARQASRAEYLHDPARQGLCTIKISPEPSVPEKHCDGRGRAGILHRHMAIRANQD